jgi:hypothetical protein
VERSWLMIAGAIPHLTKGRIGQWQSIRLQNEERMSDSSFYRKVTKIVNIWLQRRPMIKWLINKIHQCLLRRDIEYYRKVHKKYVV